MILARVQSGDAAPVGGLLVPFDLDVDSDNNNEWAQPRRTFREEEVEDFKLDNPTGIHPTTGRPILGKIVARNLGDEDGNGVPNFVEGLNNNGSPLYSDGTGMSPRFVPMVLELPAMGDPTKTKVKFTYKLSDPRQITPQEEPSGSGKFRFPLPEDGGIFRVWTLDGTADRDVRPLEDGGNLIIPEVEYTAAQLGLGTTWNKVLYVETIGDPTSLADRRIEVKLISIGERTMAAVDSVLFLPVELKVDGNRDGEMSFSDIRMHGSDQTSSVKPYKFWINNDFDKGASVDYKDGVADWEEDDYLGDHDRNYDVIEWRRDLEDLTRLWISFKGITDLVQQENISVYLEWKAAVPETAQGTATGNNAPGIRLFPAHENDGGRDYLDTEGAAWNQLDGHDGATAPAPRYFSKALGPLSHPAPGVAVAGANPSALFLPKYFLTGLSEG